MTANNPEELQENPKIKNIFILNYLIETNKIFSGERLPTKPTYKHKQPTQNLSLLEQEKIMTEKEYSDIYPSWTQFILEQHIIHPNYCPNIDQCKTLTEIERAYPKPIDTLIPGPKLPDEYYDQDDTYKQTSQYLRSDRTEFHI